MGDMFRSEEMVMAQVFIQPEAAYFVVSELGESGIVQFRDLNENVNSFQRRFVNEVRRCDEMDRKLRYIEEELKKDKHAIPDLAEFPKAPNPREIIDLEAHLEKTESDIKELSESAINLKSNFLELTQLRQVLEKSQMFFNDRDDSEVAAVEDSQNASPRGNLGFLAGVIGRERIFSFERMLWRISRGNIFLRQAEIEKPFEDPVTGNAIYKTVFVIFFQGDELKNRIKKVCTGFHADLYSCPTLIQERKEMLKGVSVRLEDLTLVLNQTQDHRQRVLVNVAKELQNWSIMVSKMKAIYHTLNFFNVDVTKKCLIGECWVPSKDLENVQKALLNGATLSGSSMPSFLNVIDTNDTPPTYNRTNKFTQGFQNLIESYGVASYREVNPALYTIVTFPFLFAVMFGDVGHAIIMSLFGLLLVIYEKKIIAMRSNSEIFNIFFSGRYIVLMMGLFSIYTGFIYNDFFSKSMNIFGSRFSVNYTYTEALEEDYRDVNPTTDYVGTPYYFGLDPVWQMADNKIIFLNSYKMKLSIIFGVTHMIFGVCVSTFNNVHFKKFSSIYLEFLPQIILLLALFVYLVVMMFMKWFMYGPAREFGLIHGTYCAPMILIYFINMMLFKETVPPKNCEAYMYSFQPTLQKVLVFIALICIPWMLLGKPLYITFTRRKEAPKVSGIEPLNEGNVMSTKAGDEEEEEGEEPLSEIYIHQAIHTIEYVLSTISHTASYLRLWALSLAHAQLSEVLWNMLFNIGLTIPGYVGAATIFAIFAAWAAFTLAILVVMEGLSAFLHTLRLHWVEFMSKFYEGLGYAFQPFSFKAIFDEENAAESE